MQTNNTHQKTFKKPTLGDRTDRARFSRLLRQPASKQSFLYSQNWKHKLIKMCKYPNQRCWTMVHTFWCCWWRRRFWWWWTGWFTSRLRQTSHHPQHCRTCLMQAHTPQKTVLYQCLYKSSTSSSEIKLYTAQFLHPSVVMVNLFISHHSA